MPDDTRVAGIQQRIQTGLGSHATSNSKQRSVVLADQLATLKEEDDIAVPFEEERSLADSIAYVDVGTLQSLRKATEVLEDDLGVNLGHSKFARIATTGAQLNSITSIAIAGYHLFQNAEELDDAAANATSIQDIEESYFEDFYTSIVVFAIECFLFATPFNYTIAWRGTRYINNRLLYRLRNVSGPLHRFVMSEIHYAIRGIPPEALRSAAEFSSYLVAITVRTIEFIQASTDGGIDDIPGRIDSVLSEYDTFVREAYSITPPDIDLSELVDDIIRELGGFLDISSLSAAQLSSEITIQ